MPYKISRSGSGFKVTSPNHPQGFSKEPQTKKAAAIQAWIIKRKTGEDGGGGGSPPKKIGVKKKGA